MSRFVRFPALAAALLVGACTVVGPEYTPPEPALPAVYHAPVPQVLAVAAPRQAWWEIFGDPVLDVLVDYGRRQNLDLRTAASRVREARALARGVEGATGPQFDISGRAGGDWEFERERGEPGESGISGSLRGLLDGTWEIDLVGGRKRARQAAWATAEQTAFLRQEAERLAVAELTAAYIQLRAAERRLDLTRQLLDLQRQTLDLVNQRVASGLAPALDQARARAAVASLEADIGPLEADVRRFRDTIAVLVAQSPGAMDAFLGTDAAIPLAEAGPAIGVPVDMVRRRPDIRAAELAIAAATYDVGVATADLYPRLTLPGSFGVTRAGIGADEVVTSVLASLAALLEYPLYDGGTRAAAVTAAEERLTQAVLGYRQTLLAALQEVESALAGYAGTRARRQALLAAEADNRLAYQQSQALYRQGFATFIDVLDSQRQWNDSLQELAIAERDLSLEVVNLYTALGGAPSLPAEDA